MQEIKDKDIYLKRMSKPLQEKLKVAEYIPKKARYVLDVGCADGTITMALAELFPHIIFLGIDLDESFINRANALKEEKKLTNVTFEKTYLRDLLLKDQKYDAVIFVSVLHEFYSYGDGISSVMKAVADAHELLSKGGEIVIRDMILNEFTKSTTFLTEIIREKMLQRENIQLQLRDFEASFGRADKIYAINHFLLKYMYSENWDRECREHYVPVTFEQYSSMFLLLGMEQQVQHSYTIQFLHERWIEDFQFSETEFSCFRSTGFIVARK